MKRGERERKKNKKREKSDRESKHRKSRREGKRKGSDSDFDGESERARERSRDCDSKSRIEPENLVRYILKEFPGVAADLEQVPLFSLYIYGEFQSSRRCGGNFMLLEIRLNMCSS